MTKLSATMQDMFLLRIFLVGSLLLLASCNLAASLTGESQSQTFSPSYEFFGQSHTMSISFAINDDEITELTIEPGAASELERAHQWAFAANMRPLVVGKKIDAIEIPSATGDEERLRKVFRGVIEELRTK